MTCGLSTSSPMPAVDNTPSSVTRGHCGRRYLASSLLIPCAPLEPCTGPGACRKAPLACDDGYGKKGGFGRRWRWYRSTPPPKLSFLVSTSTTGGRSTPLLTAPGLLAGPGPRLDLAHVLRALPSSPHSSATRSRGWRRS